MFRGSVWSNEAFMSLAKCVPHYITNTSRKMSAHKRRGAIETFSADPCGMKRTSVYS